jgi:hypothetical protein
MSSAVEQELVRESNFNSEKQYKNRQDYLAALLMATADNISDSDFERLSNEAMDWCNNAAKARKDRKSIPDFEGAELNGSNGVTTHEATVTEEKELTPSSVPPKPKKKKGLGRSGLTGELDKFGIAIGTKSSKVAAMFENGATMKEVKDTIGDTFYNLLVRLENQGHKIERSGPGNTFIKLTVKQQ